MIVNIDYDAAQTALRADLIADDDILRCQHPDCGSPRLHWYCPDAEDETSDTHVLVVDCEDCAWTTEQRFDGTIYQ